MRNLFLGAGLFFIVGFGGLTIEVAAREGVSGATVLSLVVLAMIGIGLHGAWRNPPPD